MGSGEFTLYGLNRYTEVIEDIIARLNIRAYEFDIKMILSEGIANAYFHGNSGSEELPINVRYRLENDEVTFEIEDCGCCNTEFCLASSYESNDILSEDSRGIFLISCYSDKVEYHNKTLKIVKSIVK